MDLESPETDTNMHDDTLPQFSDNAPANSNVQQQYSYTWEVQSGVGIRRAFSQVSIHVSAFHWFLNLPLKGFYGHTEHLCNLNALTAY